MDFQILLNLGLGTGLAALGWALKTMFGDIRQLNTELSAHKVEVARGFATKDELISLGERMERGFAGVNENIGRVLDKLERKADR